MQKLLQQFIKFGLVGCINTVTSLAIYYLLIFLNVQYLLASVAGYIFSSIVGFILNKFWVFQAKNTKTIQETIRYYIVYGCALLINLGMMYLQIDVLMISDKIAPLITLCVTVPFNFIMSKLWVFRVKKVKQ